MRKHFVSIQQASSCAKYLIWLKRKTCVSSTKLNNHDGFHKNRLWLDAQKDVNFSWYASVDSELATHGISSIDEVRNVPEGDECEIGPVMTCEIPCCLWCCQVICLCTQHWLVWCRGRFELQIGGFVWNVRFHTSVVSCRFFFWWGGGHIFAVIYRPEYNFLVFVVSCFIHI